MSNEFETVIEDGSAEAVAEDIVRLWDETQIGKGDLVLNFEELAEKVRDKMPNVQEQVVSDDDGEGEYSLMMVRRLYLTLPSYSVIHYIHWQYITMLRQLYTHERRQ